MALLTDDELYDLQQKMAKPAPATQYPLEPSYNPDPAPISDGLGHWWDSASQSWQNDSGGAYQEPASAYPLEPSYAAPASGYSDPWGYDAPYVTPQSAPGEYGNTWTDPSTAEYYAGLSNYQGGAAVSPEWWEGYGAEMADTSYGPSSAGYNNFNATAEPVWTPEDAKFALNYGGGQDEYIGPILDQGRYTDRPWWEQTPLYENANADKEASPFGIGGLGRLGEAAKGAWNALEGGVEAALPFSAEQRGEGARSQMDELTTDLLSGQKVQENLGIDTSYIDWLREKGWAGDLAADVIDQGTSPVTLLTAAAGPAVPILGSTFTGGLGSRIVGEAAVNAAGSFVGGKTADLASDYTDNPWLIGAAGLAGGLAGAGGVIGGVRGAKGAADNIPAIGAKLGEETGAIDLGAISDMASAGRATLPARAVAKVAPGGFEVSPGAIDSTPRIGDILHAPVLEGEYTPKQVLNIDRNLTRRVASSSNQIEAEAAPAWKALGKTFTDENGNVYFKDIAPSPAELERNLPGALAVRVIEKPGDYVLTPRQEAAVVKLGGLTDRIANERDLLGAPVNRLTGEEGDIYQHRKALKPTEAEQAERLVAEKDPRANEFNRPSGGGSRLAIGKDQSRKFEDAADAVALGAVYAHPKVAFAENVANGLTKAKNAHIKTLLEPFGQTAADRIDPAFRAAVDDAKNIVTRLEGRLGTAEKRANINAQRGTDLATMLEKQATGAAAKVDATPSEVATLNRFLTRAQNRIVELRQRGGKYRAEANALQDMLNEARANVDELLPKWETAKEAARAVPSGRRAIPHDLAPALIGTDFDKETAARIISQYGGGIRVGDKVMETKIPGAKAINALLTPINATADFSVTLNQLAITGASHPREFAKNLITSIRDMVDDANYNRWLASPETAESARWVTIYGEAGDQGDFLARGLSKIPGIAQTQKQFARFGNRMRVDAFDAVKKSAERSRPLGDTDLEQIGRAVDRVTGVSMSRATDAERIAQFAPNFFRSIIETTGHAAMDGGLEGQIARQYLKNYAALGGGIVVATALSQNRDLNEVLNPFDKKAWERGEIRLNPNWMSIRVGGQDVKVFGSYDSAIRLLVTAGDAGFQAVDQRDAYKLFGVLDYASATKGSPVAKFIHDLAKNETFGGGKPLAPIELGKRTLPISFQEGVQSIQDGRSPREIATDVGLSAIGAKASPVTDWEKRDELANKMFGANYDDPKLSTLDRQAVDAANGGKVQSTNPDAIKAAEDNAKLREENVAQQLQADDKYRIPGTNHPSFKTGKDWREDYHTGQATIQGQYQARETIDPFTGKPYGSDMDKAIAEWGAAIDAARNGWTTDWDKVDEWRSANPDKAALVDKYMAGKANTDLSPMVTEYKKASKLVGDSGFFDIRDNAWQKIVTAIPALGNFEDYYDWRDKQIANIRDQIVAKGESYEYAESQAVSIVDKTEPAKLQASLVKRAKAEWMLKDPDAAIVAWRWGYLDPTKDQEAYLNDMIKQGRGK